MKQVFVDLFSSKKFITALVGLVVALGAKYGLNLDPEIVASIIGLFATVVLGIGLADHGREAAKIKTDAVTIDLGPVTEDVVNNGGKPS